MGKKCIASISLGIGFLLIGIIFIGWYIALSIWWKWSCESYIDRFNNNNVDCGALPMYICAGWGPTIVFIWITSTTTHYIFKQSRNAIKVVEGSRAWLYLFVVALAMILYFIHFCYEIYMLIQLQDDEDCKNTDECDDIRGILIGLIVITALTMSYICCGGLGCLFGLVHGRIGTPVDRAYQIRIENQKQEEDQQQQGRTPDGDSTALLSEKGQSKHQIHVTEDTSANNKLGNVQLTELNKLDRVIVKLPHRGNEECHGTVHYYGSVPEDAIQHSITFPYLYGVELDEPKGNTNGTLQGIQYFRCAEQHGVFVTPTDIRKLETAEDPITNNTANLASIRITRKNPNHFQKEDLNALLANIEEKGKQQIANSSVMIGCIKRFRIAVVDSSNIQEVTKEFLDLLPQNILYAHQMANETNTNNFTPDGYTKSAPNVNGILFNILPAIGRLNAITEEESNTPEYSQSRYGIDLWYLELDDEWRRWSQKMVETKYVDWSIGKNSDQFNSKWVLTNHWRTQEWMSILLNLDTNRIEVPYPVIHECCVPKFIEQQYVSSIETMGNLTWRQCNPHYIPLGFFREESLGEKLDAVIEKKPNLLKEGEKIEFKLGNLMHESVQNIEELLPYLKYKLFELEESSKYRQAWFPMDWVYVEIILNHPELNSMIQTQFEQYYSRQYNSDTPPTAFNPYYCMKYARMPLCYLSTLLPLDLLRDYANKVEQEASISTKSYPRNQIHANDRNIRNNQPNGYNNQRNSIDEKEYEPDEVLDSTENNRLLNEESDGQPLHAARNHYPKKTYEEEESSP